jgi:hypothetical protein
VPSAQSGSQSFATSVVVPAANVEVQVSQRMRVARSLASAQVMINSVGLTVGFWIPQFDTFGTIRASGVVGDSVVVTGRVVTGGELTPTVLPQAASSGASATAAAEVLSMATC